MIDWSQVVERRIEEARRAGAFERLPGRGRPLALEDLSLVPPELRSSYILLKTHGFLPPEMAARKEWLRLEDLLAACTETDERESLRVEVRRARLRYRLLVEQRGGSVAAAEYREPLLRRLAPNVVVALLLLLAACAVAPSAARRGAEAAAQWLAANAVTDERRLRWRADPADSQSSVHGLYAGGPGVVLFFCELAHASSDPRWHDIARRGADGLLADVPAVLARGQPGLYTGAAGHAYALAIAHRTTGDRRYLVECRAIVRRLLGDSEQVGSGREWNPVTDVISGSAGIGLFLLWVEELLPDLRDELRGVASAVGDRLIERATRTGHGLDWAMSPNYPRRMPNFSHGTAGVCYFLARLHQRTGQQRFLTAAVAGGEHLRALAGDDGLVCHHLPGGGELFYLGWCHGPPGTSRLFTLLFELTGEPHWQQLVDHSSAAMLAAALPGGRTPGFWNNVGQCCGVAGVGEHYLRLLRRDERPDYRAACEAACAEVLARAESAGDGGVFWPQAEHRVRPELIVAQSGYMQGAAGIGLWLLHWDGFERGIEPVVRLPDH